MFFFFFFPSTVGLRHSCPACRHFKHDQICASLQITTDQQWALLRRFGNVWLKLPMTEGLELLPASHSLLCCSLLMCLCSAHYSSTCNSPLHPPTIHRGAESKTQMGTAVGGQWDRMPLVQRGGRQDREKGCPREATACRKSPLRTQPLTILQWNYCGDWLPSLKMPASIQNKTPSESLVAFF